MNWGYLAALDTWGQREFRRVDVWLRSSCHNERVLFRLSGGFRHPPLSFAPQPSASHPPARPLRPRWREKWRSSRTETGLSRLHNSALQHRDASWAERRLAASESQIQLKVPQSLPLPPSVKPEEECALTGQKDRKETAGEGFRVIKNWFMLIQLYR